jgi:hypothetical protein
MRANDIALNVGTFDQPERVTPSHHYGVEAAFHGRTLERSCPAKDMVAMVTERLTPASALRYRQAASGRSRSDRKKPAAAPLSRVSGA